jgi:hypothetical protein
MTTIDRADLPNLGSNPRLLLALNFANSHPGHYWFCCPAKIDARTIVGRAASRLHPNHGLAGLPDDRVIYIHALRNAVNPLITLLGFEAS